MQIFMPSESFLIAQMVLSENKAKYALNSMNVQSEFVANTIIIIIESLLTCPYEKKSQLFIVTISAPFQSARFNVCLIGLDLTGDLQMSLITF